MSTFNRLFRVTTYGESHCKKVGVVIDGCPPRMRLTEEDIQPQLTRRRPGQSKITTPRSEEDLVIINSGTEYGFTLGTPINLEVANTNIKPTDYQEMSMIPRPGHADFTYQMKYGVRASSGGGRASARETIGRVAAGAVAEKYLRESFGTEVISFVASVGNVEIPPEGMKHPSGRNWNRDEIDNVGTVRLIRSMESGWKKLPAGSKKDEQAKFDAKDEEFFLSKADDDKAPAYLDENENVYSREGTLLNISLDSIKPSLSDDLIPTRCPHVQTACRMVSLIRRVKSEQDSIGGTAVGIAMNVPVGLGEPTFDKLEAKLAHAMLSLPATKGFEIGSGFNGTKLRGSQHNDPFIMVSGNAKPNGLTNGLHKSKQLIRPKTNNAGGTLGGISSGEDIVFRVAVKPVSTISQAQNTVTFDGSETVLEAKGRHDPCVLARVPPLIETMAALVLIDAALIQISRCASTVKGPNGLVDTLADQEDIGTESDPTVRASKKSKYE